MIEPDGVPCHAPWPRRAAADVVDALPIVALAALALGLMWFTRIRACDGDPSVRDLGPLCGDGGISTLGRVCYLGCWLAIVGYGILNFGLRQGASGASLGKSLLGVLVVDAATGLPIGFWRSVFRQLAHVLDVGSLGIGYLWPLWDQRNQTFADKLASTVCQRKALTPVSASPMTS